MACHRLAEKEGAFMCRLSDFYISGQTWTSYEGCPSPREHVRVILIKVKSQCLIIPQHAGPWRRAAARPQDGCGEAAESQLCFLPISLPGDSASSRRIHPLPFGPPPSPRGHLLTVILINTKNFTVGLSLPMQPLREGARQRRRMDAAKPLAQSDVCRLIV